MAIKACRGSILAIMIGCLLIGFGNVQANAASDYKGKVLFYEQNSRGQIIEGGAKGQLMHNLTGRSFDFNFSASKLDKNTGYTLIFSREPEVMLPARYQEIGTGISDSGGNLSFSGSFNFEMDLLAARLILIPTEQPPDAPLTYSGKYLFAAGAIAFDDTKSWLLCGGNQSPGPGDSLGLHAGDKAIDFSLEGIAGPAVLTAGNAEQPLTPYTLSKLLESKPVLLVNGAFS